MDSQKLLTKRNIIGLVIAVLLLISLPLGIYLAQKTQIFKPRATSLPADFSGVTITDAGLTDGQTLGPIFFDFTPVAGKNVGIALWRNVHTPTAPGQKCNPIGECTAANFHSVNTPGSNKAGGWDQWNYKETVPFLIEYTNGEVDYQRVFESIKPTATVKVLNADGSEVSPTAVITDREYTIRIDATDNAKAEAGKLVMLGNTTCNDAISGIEIAAMSGTTTIAEPAWTNSFRASGRCPANGSFAYPEKLKAPFYIEYNVRDINKNLTHGTLTVGSGGGSDTTKPNSTITANPASGFVKGNTVQLTFNGTDNSGGSGVKVIHTSIWPDVSSRKEAISRYHDASGALIAPDGAYQGFSGSSGSRTARVPFYAEVRAEDNAGNLQDPPATFTAAEATADTADCRLTTPAGSSLTMNAGETLKFDATYTSNRPDKTTGEINVWTSGATKQNLANTKDYQDWVDGPGKYSTDVDSDKTRFGNTGNYISFTPKAAGSFIVTCRATNGVTTECHANDVPGYGGYSVPPAEKLINCPSNSFKTITVIGGGPEPSPSTFLPSPSPSPVVSIAFDKNDPSAVNAVTGVNSEISTFPIRINTSISGDIKQVSAIERLTIKYNKDDFDFVDITVPSTSGFNSNCSGSGPAAFCRKEVIPSDGLGKGRVSLSTIVSSSGSLVTGDPIIAHLKLRAKRIVTTPETLIEFTNDVKVVGPTAGTFLAVSTQNHSLPIKAKVYTTNYQICEVNGDIEWNNPASKPVNVVCLDKYKNLEYKNFRTTGKVIAKDYEIYDKTPGQKTIFVVFVSTDGQKKIEKILINYLPNPSVSGDNSGITCNFVGEGMEAIIYGTNFYDRSSGSAVKINNQAAEIIEWVKDVPPPGTLPSPLPSGSSQASSSPASSGAVSPSPSATIIGTGPAPKLWRVKARVNRSSKDPVPVELITANNTRVVGSCQVGVTTLDFSMQSKCGPMLTTLKENIDVTIYDAAAGARPISKSKIKVDNQGKPLDFNPPTLQKDKDYVIVVKAPKAPARAIKFKTGEGTTVLDKIDLPVGDIAPATSPDGKINSLDKGELNRQWNLSSSTVIKSGDFNEDGAVNSLDWSCMRENFNKEDEVFTGR